MNSSRTAVALAFALACGCGKKTDAPPAPPAPAMHDEGSAKPATPPAAHDEGSAKPATPPAAAPTNEDYLSTLCPKVLDKIRDCKDDASFAAALTAGASAQDKKAITKLVKGISKWALNTCSNMPTYEVIGLLDHWDQLAAPSVLESCASLGTAVKAAGGLFGGDSTY